MSQGHTTLPGSHTRPVHWSAILKLNSKSRFSMPSSIINSNVNMYNVLYIRIIQHAQMCYTKVKTRSG